ncbi:cobyric acid synthase [Alkalicoccus chagannorensis]|uniref:cobyric acid synthase n=1 Tax=Alkalicoccus chagannorensis TaxID=427072 RepID=UPI000A00D710|nr:cobyric acid synthase [Alkalicoccus chagannorensis]
MIQGTHSDSGKSILTAALCRIFAEDGFRTAPFKSQNMALNAYVTEDGKEIGRSQGMQADAARIRADVRMNPILLKPAGNQRSQVVVRGTALSTMEAAAYREDFYEKGKQVIQDAYESLASDVDRIVLEGAGSPVEVNLMERELVNMSTADMADAPVLLVADIDRGGVFASIVGTLELLPPEHRQRVKGLIINKFRGDPALFADGVSWLESYTGIPVLGVLPFVKDLYLEEEDALGLASYERRVEGIDAAILHYPWISNYHDLDPFKAEPDVQIRFVQRPEELGEPDLIILPGSKSTIEDLSFLHERGLVEALKKVPASTRMIGICGGYQMLGNTVRDPQMLESSRKEREGIGFFSTMDTVMLPEKQTIRTTAAAAAHPGIRWEGYEIRTGASTEEEKPWLCREDGTVIGSVRGRVFGTYLHDVFHQDEYRHHLLEDIRQEKGLPAQPRFSYASIREASIQHLADTTREYLDMAAIETLMTDGGGNNEKNDTTVE